MSLSGLPNHYQLRVKANFYFLNRNTTTKNAVIVIGTNSASVSGT